MSEENQAEAAPEVAPAEESQENQEVVSEASDNKDVATDAQVEQAVQMIKQLNLKVDGQEIIEELPFEVTPEQAEYIKKQAQMAKMGQKRAKEAAELKKAAQDQEVQLTKFLDMLQTDPASVLQNLGVNVNEFATAIINKEAEKMQLSPEERELQELREKLKSIEEEKEQAKKLAEEREMEHLRNQFATEMEQDLLSAIDEFSLPNNQYITGQLVQLVAAAHEEGIKATFKDVAPLIKESYEKEIKERISSMKPEDLISIMNDEVRKSIVAKSLPKEEKKAPPNADSIKEGAKIKKDSYEKQYRSIDARNFFKNL